MLTFKLSKILLFPEIVQAYTARVFLCLRGITTNIIQTITAFVQWFLKLICLQLINLSLCRPKHLRLRNPRIKLLPKPQFIYLVHNLIPQY